MSSTASTILLLAGPRTRDWTTRPCGGKLQVNVGRPGGVGAYFVNNAQTVGSATALVSMRAAVGSITDPISAYISGTQLVVAAGRFNIPLSVGTNISGPGVTTGTQITAMPDCRNEEQEAFTGYISESLLTIVGGGNVIMSGGSGSFASISSLGITGGGAQLGTTVNGIGGHGHTGFYQVSPRYTVGSSRQCRLPSPIRPLAIRSPDISPAIN